MCDQCVALGAAQDQAFAAAKGVAGKGAEWATIGLLAGNDALHVWRAMCVSLVADEECTREDFAALLAAAYVRHAQEGKR